jgi:hypothetical protein
MQLPYPERATTTIRPEGVADGAADQHHARSLRPRQVHCLMASASSDALRCHPAEVGLYRLLARSARVAWSRLAITAAKSVRNTHYRQVPVAPDKVECPEKQISPFDCFAGWAPVSLVQMRTGAFPGGRETGSGVTLLKTAGPSVHASSGTLSVVSRSAVVAASRVAPLVAQVPYHRGCVGRRTRSAPGKFWANG